jgi:hypothetical protein
MRRTTKSEHSLPVFFLLCDFPESICRRVEPSIPFAPLTTLYLGRFPRACSVGLTYPVGYSDGYMTPWGVNLTR